MSDDFQQLSMFDGLPEEERPEQTTVEGGLGPSTPFDEAVALYLEALRLSGASPHTVKAFRSDLNLLGRWDGDERPIGAYSTDTLHRFLNWMLTERDKPCSPKTYARRVTTLKNFFGWLTEQGALPKDPAAPVIQQPVKSPLPDVLSSKDVEKLREAARRMQRDAEKPDARPRVLLELLLETGIKKSECMGLRREHVVRDAEAPYIWVRYTNPRMRYKERKIPVPAAWLAALDEYLAQRQPEEGLIFDCTPRNLEYVLNDTATLAGVDPRTISFETLRWTCAYGDYRSGMDPEQLRQKLGLSRISWRETSSRLAELHRELGGEPIAQRDP